MWIKYLYIACRVVVFCYTNVLGPDRRLGELSHDEGTLDTLSSFNDGSNAAIDEAAFVVCSLSLMFGDVDDWEDTNWDRMELIASSTSRPPSASDVVWSYGLR
jgi:hypothetical protein